MIIKVGMQHYICTAFVILIISREMLQIIIHHHIFIIRLTIGYIGAITGSIYKTCYIHEINMHDI